MSEKNQILEGRGGVLYSLLSQGNTVLGAEGTVFCQTAEAALIRVKRWHC